MKIFDTWKAKSKIPKKLKYSDKKVETFYGTGTLGEMAKQFNWVHYVFKYKVFVPMILFCKKMAGKYLVKEVPDKPQYRYQKIFEKVFDDSVIDWFNMYVNVYNETKSNDRENVIKAYKEGKGCSLYVPKTIKQLVNTVCLNDDSYAEFIPFFLWNVYFQMQDMVNKGENFHLMRTVQHDMNMHEEAAYITLSKQIEDGQLKFTVTPVGMQTKDKSKQHTQTIKQCNISEEMKKHKENLKKQNEQKK